MSVYTVLEGLENAVNGLADTLLAIKNSAKSEKLEINFSPGFVDRCEGPLPSHLSDDDFLLVDIPETGLPFGTMNFPRYGIFRLVGASVNVVTTNAYPKAVGPWFCRPSPGKAQYTCAIRSVRVGTKIVLKFGAVSLEQSSFNSFRAVNLAPYVAPNQGLYDQKKVKVMVQR